MEPEKEPKDLSTELSKKRTGMSEHRTEMSEHRTDLSEQRTGLSEQRTGLSEHRTQLSDVRSHLANERTQLSYLRTGVALISFGVTLNRFSLTLLQGDFMTRDHGRTLLRDSSNIGIGMVVLGSGLLLWSIFHFVKTSKAIDEMNYKPSVVSILSFTVAVFVIGALATAWMIIG